MIIINGQSFNGNSISIIGGNISIDGKSIDIKTQPKIEVVITGDAAVVHADGPVTVKGNVTGDVNARGPVTCGNVNGNVSAGGPATCSSVGGNLKAGGPVTCGSVGGRII